MKEILASGHGKEVSNYWIVSHWIANYRFLRFLLPF